MGYACTGTPVDCVRLVALGLMDFEPDLVVSGINHGENLGDDITYSGTVAGAMEGIVIGVPGIAVSLSIERPWHETVEENVPLDDGLHFGPVAEFAARLAKLAYGRLPKGRILNVNAPNLPAGEAQGRAGHEARAALLQGRAHRGQGRGGPGRLRHLQQPARATTTRRGPTSPPSEPDEISVTPVHLELTDEAGHRRS